MQSRIRSPAGVAGNWPSTATATVDLPKTLMRDVFWVTRARITCGSIARFLMALTMAACMCEGVFPAALIAPAYGIVIFPLVSIGWLGSRHKIDRPHTRFDGYKQSACSRFKDRYTHDIADPELDLRRRPLVAKYSRDRQRAKVLE
jgi:hypothetical protein